MAPESPNLVALEAAYRRGRRARVLVELVPVIIYVAVLGLVSGLRPQVIAAMAFALLLAIVGLWRGQGMGRAVYPGMLVGLVPFACSFAGGRLGHVCTGDTCVSLCMPLCALGGAVAGLLVARAVRRDPSTVLALGMGSLALAVGSLGCPHAGLTSLTAMGLGILAPLGFARLFARSA